MQVGGGACKDDGWFVHNRRLEVNQHLVRATVPKDILPPGLEPGPIV